MANEQLTREIEERKRAEEALKAVRLLGRTRSQEPCHRDIWYDETSQ